MKHPENELMLMNWPERVWIYSPVRVFFLRREAAKWMSLAPPSPDMKETALEIGCGLGKGAAIIAERMGFRHVTAFDYEEILARRARKGAPDRLAGVLDFFTGDAQDLPFRDTQFHAVVNFGIIHHVLDWRRAISEVSRVLKPGGTFYFEEIYPPLYANFILKRMLRHPTDDRFDGAQFLAQLAACGMRLVPGVCTDSRYGIVGAAVRD